METLTVTGYRTGSSSYGSPAGGGSSTPTGFGGSQLSASFAKKVADAFKKFNQFGSSAFVAPVLAPQVIIPAIEAATAVSAAPVLALPIALFAPLPTADEPHVDQLTPLWSPEPLVELVVEGSAPPKPPAIITPTGFDGYELPNWQDMFKPRDLIDYVNVFAPWPGTGNAPGERPNLGFDSAPGGSTAPDDLVELVVTAKPYAAPVASPFAPYMDPFAFGDPGLSPFGDVAPQPRAQPQPRPTARPSPTAVPTLIGDPYALPGFPGIPAPFAPSTPNSPRPYVPLNPGVGADPLVPLLADPLAQPDGLAPKDPCNCAPCTGTKKKKKSDKPKPRTVCYEGKFREYSSGTAKFEKRIVACATKPKATTTKKSPAPKYGKPGQFPGLETFTSLGVF